VMEAADEEDGQRHEALAVLSRDEVRRERHLRHVVRALAHHLAERLDQRIDLDEVELDAAPAIYDAFVRAKDAYLETGELDPMHARVAEITGGDPLPYGVEANRATIDELIDHALRQKILRKRPDVDALFARA
jgi:hypothetical protein